jgi:hypothetical protein
VPYARAGNNRAVRALQTWLQAAEIHRGPVFRQMRRGDTLTERRLSDQSVALIVKRRAQSVGLPPTFLSGVPVDPSPTRSSGPLGIADTTPTGMPRR